MKRDANRPRRVIAQTLVSASLGVVTTVSVGWFFAFARPPGSRYDDLAACAIADGTWEVVRIVSRSRVEVESLRHTDTLGALITAVPNKRPESLIPSWGGFPRTREAASAQLAHRYRVMAVGWPQLCLWQAYVDAEPPEGEYERVDGAIETPWPWAKDGLRVPRALPIRVLYAGFAVNAFIYAALWFALLFGFGATRTARRAIRKRRGLCPMCKYNVRGDLDSGCPECGWNRPENEGQESSA